MQSVAIGGLAAKIRRRSKAEWGVIVDEYPTSGRSLGSSCREQGVSESSVHRRLRRRSEQAGEFVIAAARTVVSTVRGEC